MKINGNKLHGKKIEQKNVIAIVALSWKTLHGITDKISNGN